MKTRCASRENLNPSTAGAEYFRVFIFYQHIKYHLLNMFKIKCDNNQQDLKRVDLHFHSLEVCGSRQRDTTSCGLEFKLNNLAVKGLIKCVKLIHCLRRWPNIKPTLVSRIVLSVIQGRCRTVKAIDQSIYPSYHHLCKQRGAFWVQVCPAVRAQWTTASYSVVVHEA